MVVRRTCSFCAEEIEPGTGLMFVKRDGSVFYFCSGTCRKHQLELHRVGHRLKWTRAHAIKVEAGHRTRSGPRSEAPTTEGKPAPSGKETRPPPPAAEDSSKGSETGKAPEPAKGRKRPAAARSTS
jgi:large subunit ribosomal protein L24e